MGTKELEKKSSGGGLVAAWKQNPLVSTGLVLILMIVVQTAIMIYNFGEGSVGELLRCWAGSTACSSPTASCPPSSPPWAPCRSSAPSPST